MVKKCVVSDIGGFATYPPLPNDYTFAETYVISYFADIAISQQHSNIHAINEEWSPDDEDAYLRRIAR